MSLSYCTPRQFYKIIYNPRSTVLGELEWRLIVLTDSRKTISKYVRAAEAGKELIAYRNLTMQVSIYDDNLSSNEKRESLRCCKRLITNAGGVVREDLGAVLGLILCALPSSCRNLESTR